MFEGTMRASTFSQEGMRNLILPRNFSFPVPRRPLLVAAEDSLKTVETEAAV